MLFRSSGAELGVFRKNVSGLEEGKTYYVRAYVTNKKGTVYGNEIEMDFNAIMPIVSTQEVTGKIIAQGIATLHGTIESKGDPAYAQRGFVYGIAHNPTKDDATVINVSGTNTGTYTYNLNNLEMGSVYYVRAFATSSKGTAYGDEVALDFNAIMPEVTTISATVQDTEHIYLIGNIVAVGDPEYIERGFIYGTMQTPMIDDADVAIISVPKNSSTQFEKQVIISGLESNTMYFRTYAKSVAGIVYGEIKQITPEILDYVLLPTFIFQNETYRICYTRENIKYGWDADSFCKNLVYGSYSDWVLPSEELLKAIYFSNNKDWFKSTYYWTSTYHSEGGYAALDLSDGTLVYQGEMLFSSANVRCVRKEN